MPNPAPQPTPTATATAAAHLFKGLEDWIEVFRAGSHTDSKGQACAFTTGDLDEMVANVALGKPPAVIGHPKHDDPAYGWGELKREGESLFARFDDVNPAFAAGVQSGAYRNRSVSVLKDKAHGWRVRHIGWLGAAPPAIDGLQPVAFSADEGDLHEFAAPESAAVGWALDDVALALRAVRDWLIDDKGLELADRVMPDWRVSSITSAAARLREAPAASALFTALTGAPMPATPAHDDLQRTATETEARVRQEVTAQFSAQAEELKRLKAERQADRIKTQIGAWQQAALVTPAEVAGGLAEFMAGLEDAAAEFQFTAPGAEQPTKKGLAAWFAEFMAQRTPLLRLGQAQATADGAPAAEAPADNADIAERARQFQADAERQGRRISIGQALDAVTRPAQP